MKKILVVTSVASMVDQFILPNIRLLQDMGYVVHVACNFEFGNTCSDEKIVALKEKLENWKVSYFQIDFARNVFKVTKNSRAYKQIKKLLMINKYDLVHCHSPIGGLVTRMAARKERKKGVKVIYTAHGFHFYKGAPKKNWLLYYPVEKICSFFTDVLITINHEDYYLAQKKMKAQKVVYVPGVGIELEKYKFIEDLRQEKRAELGIPQDAVLLISVGELNENKNHKVVLQALSQIKNVYYIIAGKGNLQEYLQQIICEYEITERVKLLGFRGDVLELYKCADVYVFPSFREGLSVAVMEAMASGLPVACSRIRGNVDLIDECGGVFFEPNDVESCRSAIKMILKKQLNELGQHNREKIKAFEINVVNERLKEIYRDS